MNEITGNNEHERYVFLVDEVVFEVTYDERYEEVDLERISIAINEFLRKGEDGSWRRSLAELDPAELRIVDFPSATQSGGFALIPLTILDYNEEALIPDYVLNLLNEAYAEFGGTLTVAEGNENGEVEGINLEDGFTLTSISPNWFASDLHHGATTGGPGSMPAWKPFPADTQRKFKLKGKEQRLDSLLSHKPPAAGEGVQIAILDTAISLDDGIVINTGTELAPEPVNFSPQIKELLTGIPSHPDYPYLQVVPYPYPDELDEYDPYATWPHHYEMPDHGTFIASIIRAIAPSVKIYLYQVLNRFGVGSLISIAEGVVNAVRQRGNNTIPVVVMNCSFMLEHDLEELDLSKKWPELTELLKPEVQESLIKSMKDIFRWATTPDLNVIVVAAAGNDGKDENGDRIAPRYPAAFENVLSVAALPKGNPRHPQSNTASSRKYKPATYSNLGHSSGSNKEAYSFATFGGELVNGSSSPSGGVLGVYIGGIPTQNPDGTFDPGPANTTCWAQWSGTSFAAPIIAALLAAQESELEADNPNVPLSDPPDLGRPYRTVDDENVILVRQGN